MCMFCRIWCFINGFGARMGGGMFAISDWALVSGLGKLTLAFVSNNRVGSDLLGVTDSRCGSNTSKNKY